jgi:hypothetical protein
MDNLLTLEEAATFSGTTTEKLLKLVSSNSIEYLGLETNPIFKREYLLILKHLLIVDIHTGNAFHNALDAARSIGIDAKVLISMLEGKERNRTPFKLA